MTISEIAKLAGVSNAAVSRYLNNGYLSEDKKAAIKKVIDETGYQPSLQAQILRTRKAKLCGIIFQNVLESDYGPILNGVTDILDEMGYGLLFARAEANDEDLLSRANDMRKRLVDGLIILTENISSEVEEQLSAFDIPLLIAGCKCDKLHSVYYDQQFAIQEITKLLLKGGKTRPAFVGLSPSYKQQGAGRFDGFRQALASTGAMMDTKVIVLCDTSIDNGYNAGKALLTRVPGIDAICCATDELAIGVLRYLKEIDRTDIAVSGCGNSPVLSSADIPILSGDLNMRSLAMTATEYMNDLLDRKDTDQTDSALIQKRLPVKIVNLPE